MTVSLVPTENCLHSVHYEFMNLVEDKWFDNPIVAEMIKDVDQTIQISPRAFDSPVLGSISQAELSGGVKGLILLLCEPEWREYSSAIWGENCVPWLLKLSSMVDFTLVMQHSLELYGYEPIQAQTVDGLPLHNAEEVWDYYVDNEPQGID